MSASGDDPFLTVAEVAELLKLNQQTVRNWVDRGELPAVRVGQRRVRIKRSDLDRLIDNGYTARAPAATALPEPGSAVGLGSSELWERFGAASAALGEAIASSDEGEIVLAFREAAATPDQVLARMKELGRHP